MTNEIKIFENQEFGQVRTVVNGDKVLFCGKDVATVLGYSAPSKAICDHCKGVTKIVIPSNGGNQETSFIPEGDVYRLIVSSKLENAQKFETWLFDEVLPTIRKTGGYVANDDLFINTYLPGASEETKILLRGTLETMRRLNKEKEELEVKNQELVKEVTHKEDVIIGLVKDISLADKRQIITRVVRKGVSKNYSERYAILYKEFEQKFHCDLQRRLDGYNYSHKPKIKNKMDYIDKVMGMIPELYELCVKLFENDVNILKQELYAVA